MSNPRHVFRVVIFVRQHSASEMLREMRVKQLEDQRLLAAIRDMSMINGS